MITGNQTDFPMSLTFELWIRWPSRWSGRLVDDNSVNTKAWIRMIYESVFLPFSAHAEISLWVLPSETNLNELSFFFSPQSAEQKQTPVPSRASLPVQPQTRTTVSTPFLFFHPRISHLSLALPPSLSLCSLLSPFDVLRDPCENTATVQCQNLYPGWRFKSRARCHSAALCSRGEVKRSVCMCVCARFLRGESVPGANVLLGPVRNFYSGIWSFPRAFRV